MNRSKKHGRYIALISAILLLGKSAGAFDTIKKLAENNKVQSEGGWDYQRFLQAACRSADSLLQRAPDRYGPTFTPLWLSVVSPTGESLIKSKPPNWQTYWDAEDYVMTAQGCNLYRDLPMLSAFYELSSVTGDTRYRSGVDAYLSFYLSHLPSPTTGLFPWGEHMSYNTVRDKLIATRHEMEHNIPDWELLWNINPTAVQKEIEAIYNINIYDKERFLYDRHANYYSGEFDPLPVRGTYIKHSGLIAYSFMFLYSNTHDPQHLQWARKMASLYWQHRDPKTEIVPGYVSHHGASDVSTVQLWLAYYLMKAVELVPDPVVQEIALKMTDSYLKYGYRPSGLFATQLVPATGQATWPDSSQFSFPDFPEYFRVQACWQAFCLSKDKKYLHITQTALQRIAQAAIPRNLSPQAAGTIISILVDVYSQTGERSYLQYARTLADWTLAHLVDHDLILESAGGYVYHNYNRPGELLRAWIKLYKADREESLHWTTKSQVRAKEKAFTVTAQYKNSAPELLLQAIFHDGKKTDAKATPANGEIVFAVKIPGSVAQGPAHLVFMDKRTRQILGEGQITISEYDGPPECSWSLPAWADRSAPFSGALTVAGRRGVMSVKCFYNSDSHSTDSVLCTAADAATGKYVFTLPALKSGAAKALTLWAMATFNPGYPVRWTSSEQQVPLADAKTITVSLEKNQSSLVSTGLADIQLRVESPVEPVSGIIKMAFLPHLPDVQKNECLPGMINLQPDAALRKTGVRIHMQWPYRSQDADPFLPGTLKALRWHDKQWLAVAGSSVDAHTHTVTAPCDSGGTFALAGQRRLWWRRYFNGALLSSPAAVRMDHNGTLAIILDTRDADGILYALDQNGNTLWSYDAGEMQPFATIVDLDNDGVDEIIVGGPRLVAFKADGTERWRVPLPKSNSAVAGDINADGATEIVATCADGTVAAFTASGKELWRLQTGESLKIPCLADMDGKRSLNIVVGGDRSLFCISGSGRILWQVETPGKSLYAAAVGDLNGDGREEVVNLSRTDDQGFLCAYNQSGKEIWRALVSREPDWCPIIADMDGNGAPRILAQAIDPRKMELYDGNGQLVRTIPTTGRVLQTAVPLDLNQDKKLDLLLHSDLSYRMWAIANDGSPLWSYTPASLTLPGAKIKGGGSLLIADFDKDGYLDVIGGDDETWLNAVKTETPCAPGQIISGQFHGDCRHSGNYMRPASR